MGFSRPDHSVKNYSPVRQCIYCDCTEDLTNEHIIAKGLGGRWTLPLSSCKKCAAITGKFEGDVLYKQDITYQEQVLDTNSERYSDSDTADILSVNAQIRHLLTDSIELNAGIGYERLHDEESENNTVLHVGANYAITADWLVTAAYRDVNDYSDLTFSIRYNF